MTFLLLLALVFIGIAAVSVARALGSGRAHRRERLAALAVYGFSPSDFSAPLSASRSVLRGWVEALANRLGDFLNSRLDTERQAEMRRMLYAAGLYNTTAKKFLGYRALATVSLAAFWLWLTLVSGSSPVSAIFGIFAAAALGWVAPTFVVRRRATARNEQIDYELPELVDLLVIAIESGLAITASLQLVSRSFEGPLGQELRLVLQEQAMGLSTSQALSNMLTRIETPAVRALVQAVVQGETLGVSIGKTFRDLASEMRSRRRHAAQERAHKAGTKVIFPLVLLIFPSLIVVVLGSILFSLTRATL